MTSQPLTFAKKTFVALKNPYKSVEQVFPIAIDELSKCDNPKYVGVKNQNSISESFLLKLRKADFILHTIDKMGFGGRATDLTLINPITGKPMTGSSSGTAVNVRVGINDLGIGTDGGGSVLMPALSLNLYGFISKLIGIDDQNRFIEHNSTDGIPLKPSVGLIARDIETIRNAYNVLRKSNLKRTKVINERRVLVQIDLKDKVNFEQSNFSIDFKKFPSINSSRLELISFLNAMLSEYDAIISNEGPIDLYGIGDTIIGHLGDNAKQIQDDGNKFLSKVVNMVEATGLAIPTSNLGEGILIVTKGSIEDIDFLFELSEYIPKFSDKLINEYFSKLETYFPRGFGYPSY